MIAGIAMGRSMITPIARFNRGNLTEMSTKAGMTSISSIASVTATSIKELSNPSLSVMNEKPLTSNRASQWSTVKPPVAERNVK